LRKKDAGASIGIEAADDVEVRNSDATSVLEEDKVFNSRVRPAVQRSI